MKEKTKIIILSILVAIGIGLLASIVLFDKDFKELTQADNKIKTTNALDGKANNKTLETKEPIIKVDEIETQSPTKSEENNSANNSNSSNNKVNSNENSSSANKPASSVIPSEPDDKITDSVSSQDSTKENIIETKPEVSNKPAQETTPEPTYSTKDTTVINELNTISTKTDALLKENNSSSVLTKAKGVFISLVDFCFYDGEIKGVTFKELTDAGKEKVLAIVSSIDSKIEAKFPGYKNKISTKLSGALNKASEVIKKGAQNINNFAYDKLGEENYNLMIEEKDELVKYSKNAVDIVGNIGSKLFNSAKDKLKTWYEKFRENNR